MIKQFKYKQIKRRDNGEVQSTLPRTFEMYPSRNELSHFDESSSTSTSFQEWEATQGIVLGADRTNKILPNSHASLVSTTLKGFDGEEAMIWREVTTLEPNTKYFISVYVRNNSTQSTQLYLNDELKDFNYIRFTQRMGGVATSTSDGKIKIGLRYYDTPKRPSGTPAIMAWVGGWFATKLDEELEQTSTSELKKLYPYVQDKKEGITAYDILSKDAMYSPYKFAILVNGRRLLDYHKPLDQYGLIEEGEYEVVEVENPEAILNAFYNDVPLMAMLQQDKMHVSHAFPKEDDEMSLLSRSHFPRIQYFTGFSVTKQVIEGKPATSEVNYAINVYIPTYMVLDSVNALMITEQVKGIMAELGWASVRGSDYFLKKEQLYVLQTQFIKDTSIIKR